jgi:hypothetical protein
VQQRDREDEGAEEPVRDVDVRRLARFDDRAEEHDRVGHPDERDQDVDRPFELGVFLAARVAERKRDAASTITACQPQNVNAASGPQNSRTWQVRCTT